MPQPSIYIDVKRVTFLRDCGMTWKAIGATLAKEAGRARAFRPEVVQKAYKRECERA